MTPHPRAPLGCVRNARHVHNKQILVFGARDRNNSSGVVHHGRWPYTCSASIALRSLKRGGGLWTTLQSCVGHQSHGVQEVVALTYELLVKRAAPLHVRPVLPWYGRRGLLFRSCSRLLRSEEKLLRALRPLQRTLSISERVVARPPVVHTTSPSGEKLLHNTSYTSATR